MWCGFTPFRLSAVTGCSRRLVRPLRSALLPFALGLAWLAGLSGCAGTKREQQAALAGRELIWPSPPEEPRIGFVQSIRRPVDVGVTVSGIGRLANWITGADKGNEQLVKPFGLFLDEKDNLCLTDTGANAVSYFDRTRKTWQRWTKVGAVRFVSPVAIAARSGLFYVADSGRASVVVFNLKGQLQQEITNHLARPSGLTIVQDRLVVADAQRHCVVSFDLTGRFLSEFGHRGSGDGEFNFPTHIAMGTAGRLFVTDSMNSRIQVFDDAGRFKSRIGAGGDAPGSFSRPKGVAVDSFGHVYVVDALFDNLQIFDAEGRFLLNLGESGSKPGQFWLPNGLAISRRNEIFIADSYNRRVQVLRYIGQP